METDIKKLANKVKSDFAGLPDSYRADLEPALSRYLTIGEEPKDLTGVRVIVWDAVKLALTVDMLSQKKY
ncbi:MAG: hypothetical protein NC311_13950 [Muribaculaceae bacterium]|nr:hypothetical protein [Muribaculaceae bacterium]